MIIQEIMTTALERIEAGTTITEAAKLMDKNDVGCLAVVEGDSISGVITDRDIVIRAIAAGKEPTSTPVREAMTTSPVYCHTDDTVETVATRMCEEKIRRLIVQDQNGVPVGMISLGDLASRGHIAELTGHVMEDVCQGT